MNDRGGTNLNSKISPRGAPPRLGKLLQPSATGGGLLAQSTARADRGAGSSRAWKRAWRRRRSVAARRRRYRAHQAAPLARTPVATRSRPAGTTPVPGHRAADPTPPHDAPREAYGVQRTGGQAEGRHPPPRSPHRRRPVPQDRPSRLGLKPDPRHPAMQIRRDAVALARQRVPCSRHQAGIPRSSKPRR